MKTLFTALNSKQSNGFIDVTHGIDVDRELFCEEIEVQKAWAFCLSDKGHLSAQDRDLLIQTLDDLAHEMRSGDFQWKKEDEDIHMSLERNLTERIGEIGKRVHLGRSRNDLIATTLKLYLANRCFEFSKLAAQLGQALVELSEKNLDVIVPALTHAQAAQPIRVAHLTNFHSLNFINDAHRIASCRSNLLSVMPFGSGAVAGTHLDVDLKKLANRLNFRSPPVNSIHGVSDRDGVIEFSQVLALLGLHLAKLCDDIIFLSSSPVGLLMLPESWSSGSSMMPNKRNPDFFEVVRAKAKRFINVSSEVMSINLGLIAGYSSDLHEQKRVIIEAIPAVKHVFVAFTNAIQELKFNPARAQTLLQHGHILATDVVHDLVDQGINFREAYKEVARQVVIAEARSCQVGRPDKSYESAVEARNNFGGTSRAQVQECITWLRKAAASHLVR